MAPIANTSPVQTRPRSWPALTRSRRSRTADTVARGGRLRREAPAGERGFASSYGPLSQLDTTDGGW